MKSEIQVYIVKLLQMCAHEIPTAIEKHNITLNDDYDLALNLYVQGKWLSVTFDDNDISVPELFDEIKIKLKSVGCNV